MPSWIESIWMTLQTFRSGAVFRTALLLVGLALLMATSRAEANQIVNGSFETQS